MVKKILETYTRTFTIWVILHLYHHGLTPGRLVATK